jgi:hypothetical protein
MNGSNQRHDDDYDDIMSQVMQRGGSPARPLPPPPPKQPAHPQKPVRKSQPFHLTHPITHSAPASAAQPKKARRRRKGLWKALLVPIIVALGGTGGYVLWQGPVQQLLYPSPFNKQLRAASDFALYYPTALPEGYGIKKDSVTTPTTGVVVYAITGESKSNITVSEQKLPQGLDLTNLLKSYKDVTQTETPAGTAHIGVQTGEKNKQTLIAHIVGSTTWMIVNTDANAMSRGDFETILKSLKEG